MKVKLRFLILSSLFTFILYSCSEESDSKSSNKGEVKKEEAEVPEQRVEKASIDTINEIRWSDEVKKTEEENTGVGVNKENQADKYGNQAINTHHGKDMDLDSKGDLLNDSAQEVILKKEEECGEDDCGKLVHLINLNDEKGIVVLIEISWKEEDKKKKSKRSYDLEAGKSIEIGCSMLCKDGQKTAVKYKIIGASYAS